MNVIEYNYLPDLHMYYVCYMGSQSCEIHDLGFTWLILCMQSYFLSQEQWEGYFQWETIKGRNGCCHTRCFLYSYLRQRHSSHNNGRYTLPTLRKGVSTHHFSRIKNSTDIIGTLNYAMKDLCFKCMTCLALPCLADHKRFYKTILILSIKK